MYESCLAYNGYDYTSDAALANKISNVMNGDVAILKRASDNALCTCPIGSYIGLYTDYYIAGADSAGTGRQCWIYANAVYYYLFGDVPGNGGGPYKNSRVALRGLQSLSYSECVNAGVKCGTYIRTTANVDGSYNGNYGHSLIVLSYDQSTMTWIDCNSDWKAGVWPHTQTWDSFNNDHTTGRGRRISHALIPINGSTGGNFRYSIETCVGNGGVIYLKGWVYNSENVTRSIQIHAYLDGGPGSGAQSWAIPADVERTDIDAVYHIGAFHGFDYTIKGVAQGQHTLQLFANDQYLNDNIKIGDFPVQVTADSFAKEVEECRGDVNSIYLKGWAYNNDNITRSIQIHAYLDGGPGSGALSWAIPADVERTDIDEIYHIGAFHGFDYSIMNIPAGTHTVYLFVNDQYRHTNEPAGVYEITVTEQQNKTPTILTVAPSDSLLSLLAIEDKDEMEDETAYYAEHIREHLTVVITFSDGSTETVENYDVTTRIEHDDSKPLIYGFDYTVTYGDLTDTTEINITLKPTPVFGDPDFILPSSLTVIDESAFEGIAASVIYVPDTCINIEKWAFRNCPNLTHIRIPADCVIGTDAFDGCTDVLIFGTKGSAAEVYASSHANCTFVAE